MNRINIIENWIRRLPLPINIEYNNSKILELSISWGYLSEDATEQIKEYTIDHYWNFIATQINHLFTGFRIPKEGK